MKQQSHYVVWGVLGLLAGFSIASLFYGGWRGYEGNRWGMMGMRGSIDRHFIEEMIPHHESAIAMAQVALARETSSELRTLALAIIETQTMEIEQMRAWYRSWFGTDVPKYARGSMGGMMGHGGMGIHMQGMSGDLDRLVVATDFQAEFARQMISHHEMAIMMARMLAASTRRPDMRQFARAIIETQSAEIELMREWVK